MAHSVGPKGQVVIEKDIRDRLGVKPGWRALQVLVEDHVEIHFLPPEHRRSIAGCLSGYAEGRRGAGDSGALRDARAAAWEEAAKRRMAGGSAGEHPKRAG